LDDARDILLEWAGVVSQGMLPNRFPDLGDEPKYNSVDASLWYIIAVYHQGTVWPWLIGAFVEAWLRVRAGTLDAKGQARQRFLSPLMEHLDSAGLGHVSEIADADPPHTARGCSFQAWSLGELLWLNRVVLADAAMARKSCIEPA
jgi:glycogen debranching enzyme